MNNLLPFAAAIRNQRKSIFLCALSLLTISFGANAQVSSKTQDFSGNAATPSTYGTNATAADATNSGSAGYFTTSFTQPGFGAFGSADNNNSTTPNIIPVVFARQFMRANSTNNQLTFDLGQDGQNGYDSNDIVTVKVSLNGATPKTALTINGTVTSGSQRGPSFAIGTGGTGNGSYDIPQTVLMGTATNTTPSQNAIGKFIVTLPNFNSGTGYPYGATVDVTITITASKKSTVLIDNVTISSGSPLPVELTRFDATAKAAGVSLTWATATEKNSDRFEIQRSATGEAFETRGTVKGQGSTTMAHNYSFVDSRPLAGTSYYRLRQVDTDGTFSFSPVVAVQTEASTKVAFYPNPSANQLIMPAGVGAVQYRIFNALGQTLLSGKATDNDRLDITSLPKGPFFLELSGAAGHHTQRLMRE
jgi:hypothetical protein